jgi:hypothetical protein
LATNNKYPKLSDFPKFDQNPFLSEVELKRNFKENENDKLNGGLRGILNGTKKEGYVQIIFENEFRDSSPFIKVYAKGFTNLPKLCKSGIEIFALLLPILEYNQTEIYIPEYYTMEKCGWSTKKNHYRGLGSLVKNGYLACTKSPNRYFINPQMLFKGNRLTTINSAKMIKKES